jgi:hypothetical protein
LDLVEHVSKYPDYQHTATRLWNNEEAKCFDVLDKRLVQKWGKKRIARTVGISKWSVDAILDEAEKRGILAPWKERVSQKLGAVIEDGLDEIHDRINAGSVPDNVLPVVVGVAFDKKKDLDGGGLPPPPAAPVLNVEALNLVWVTPVESASVGLVEISASKPALPAPGPTLGTTLPPSTAPLVELVPVQAGQGPANAEGGEGGPKNSIGGHQADASAKRPPFAKGSSEEGPAAV